MKTIIEIAREAGFNKNELAYLGDNFTRFAALVLANNPPDSSMAWQEGCDAGRLSEREAVLHLAISHGAPWSFQEAIRARGNT